MELIVLAKWVKFTTQFIPRLAVIVLSGTESNRGITFISRLAIFNPGLAIIGFPGTGACTSKPRRSPDAIVKC